MLTRVQLVGKQA